MSSAVDQTTAPSVARTSTLPVVERHRVLVRGLVQGVGFRPFVHVLATRLELTGSVVNDSDGVVIEVEGPAPRLTEFRRELTGSAPPLAVVEEVDVERVALRGGRGFVIGDSVTSVAGRTLAAPDVATCADCLADLADPDNRRYRHPFVSCTNCGPRFTIITGLPYDRAATTMAGFAMCTECAGEYGDPADRRFHAQPIACPVCGPRLEFTDGRQSLRGDTGALARARELLAAGDIIAVKGLGGYHLACNADDAAAVAALRARKRRGDKPFAVMVANLDTARRLAEVGSAEADLLTDPARPIVLLRRIEDLLAPAVAPGNPDVGIMLPYTPLHTLLFGLPGDPPGPEALVMTSGNLSGEPIVTDDTLAEQLLAPMVRGWLRHDREIHVPCDDSVYRVVDGEPLPIRRSRGFAPLPVRLPLEVRPTLAVGADLKNTCCFGDGRYAFLSQHIGDMDDLRSMKTLDRTATHLEALTGIGPVALVSDRHPGYRSVQWANRHRDGRILRQVQHHHAHICSAMAENGVPATATVIGIAFDGTGFGLDGAIWGGEVLIAGYHRFRRFGHLRYVPLPGGDAAVQRPYRMALAHLRAAGVPWDDDLPPVRFCPAAERAVLDHQLVSGLGCIPTSSMGRLFDTVSALAGVRQTADYEAQAAVELEGIARPAVEAAGAAYRFPLLEPQAGRSAAVQADPGPVLAAIVGDLRSGTRPAVIGARFHAAVADLAFDLALRAGRQTGLDAVALSGGVFQNALLLSMLCDRLRAGGFTVLKHRRVPPNDGGLALGQLAAGAEEHH